MPGVPTPPLDWVELRGFEPLTPSMRITVPLDTASEWVPSVPADLAGSPVPPAFTTVHQGVCGLFADDADRRLGPTSGGSAYRPTM